MQNRSGSEEEAEEGERACTRVPRSFSVWKRERIGPTECSDSDWREEGVEGRRKGVEKERCRRLEEDEGLLASAPDVGCGIARRCGRRGVGSPGRGAAKTKMADDAMLVRQ